MLRFSIEDQVQRCYVIQKKGKGGNDVKLRIDWFIDWCL